MFAASVRTAACCLALCCLFLLAGGAHAASISGPSSSATGNFTLTWTPGYHLRLADADWEITPYEVGMSPPSSYAFSDLAPGTWTFQLMYCEEFWGYPDVLQTVICSAVAGTEKTVTVSRDAASPITATSEAGTTPYGASVSHRGSSHISVPVRALPVLNGNGASLSLEYDSARESDRKYHYTLHDTLGYGWRLEGLSMIRRCRVGLAGSSVPQFDATDRLCLDDEPLVAVSGSYWNHGTQYRTERQSFVKVTQSGSSHHNMTFHVEHPDGRIANYGIGTGWTPASGVSFSWNVPLCSDPEHPENDQCEVTIYAVVPNPTWQWGLEGGTDAEGNAFSATWWRRDGYGELLPRSISQGDTTITFGYDARSDLPAVEVGEAGSVVKRGAILSAIRVHAGAQLVREYRLESSTGTSRRLTRIQECGDGACLQPLVFGWTTVGGAGAEQDVNVVGSVLDGLGASTTWTYAAIDANSSGNKISASELVGFAGTLSSVPNATNTGVATAAVTNMTLPSGASLSYQYEPSGPRRSTVNRGLLGFGAVRVADSGSGIHTYSQVRLDWPFIGIASHVRSYTGAAGASGSIQLSQSEIDLAAVQTHAGVKFPYTQRALSWTFEGGARISGALTELSPCFQGPACSGSATEYPTRMTSTVRQAATSGITADAAFTASVWGDVQDRGVPSPRMTATTTADLLLPGAKWILLRPTVVTSEASGTGALEGLRRIRTTMTYDSNGNPTQTKLFAPDPGVLAEELTRSRVFAATGTLTSETVSGSGLSSRTTTFGSYADNGLFGTTTNPYNWTSSVERDEFGEPATIIDMNGDTTEIVRDAFGRVTSVTDPDGNVEMTTYERCDVAGVDCSAVPAGSNVAMKIETTRSHSLYGMTAPERRTYLDTLGRTVLNTAS
jgi:YD repeat-containing protein